LPEGANTTTIESKTNFLGSAPVGVVLTAEALPVHRGALLGLADPYHQSGG
jgi:acyl-coenzyme A thioesterase PaaI-like protein